MQPRTAVLTPILMLLRSRKFIVAVSSLIATVLVTYVPELQDNLDVVILAIVVVASVVIGGQSFEDALIQGRKDTLNVTSSGNVKTEIDKVARVALEEKLANSNYSDEDKELLRQLLNRLLGDSTNE